MRSNKPLSTKSFISRTKNAPPQYLTHNQMNLNKKICSYSKRLNIKLCFYEYFFIFTLVAMETSFHPKWRKIEVKHPFNKGSNSTVRSTTFSPNTNTSTTPNTSYRTSICITNTRMTRISTCMTNTNTITITTSINTCIT